MSGDSSETPEPHGPIVVVNPENKRSYLFSVQHVFAFVICTVIGREYSLWQPALSHGFGIFGVAQILVAGAFINYFLSLCEVWSAIPFSGGGYGLTRASMGFFIGFLDGCNEALVYIIHTSVSATFLGTTLCKVFELNSHLSLLFMFAFYLLAVGLTVHKNLNVLRWTYILLTFVSVVILLIFCFGAMKYTNFMENASLHASSDPAAFENWFRGGMKQFMTLLQFATLPYAGIKSFTLLCPVVAEPKKNIPSGAKWGFSTIFCINMLVIFVTASLPGGIVHTSSVPAPMSIVFKLLFNTNAVNTFRTTALLSLPASFAKMVAYVLPCGTILHSLGSTNLLPSVLCLNHTKDYTNGAMVSGVLGFLLCILTHFVPTIDLYGVAIISTMFSNCVALYGYIQLKTTYSNIERGFTSPTGNVGVVYAMIMFGFVFVSVAFFQSNYFALQFIAVYFVLLTIYYYGFAEKTQTLSEEEDKILLQLHVRNYNIQKKKAIHHHIRNGGRKVAPGDSQRSNLKSPAGQREGQYYASRGSAASDCESHTLMTPADGVETVAGIELKVLPTYETIEESPAEVLGCKSSEDIVC